jgi:hypothetical protein
MFGEEYVNLTPNLTIKWPCRMNCVFTGLENPILGETAILENFKF